MKTNLVKSNSHLAINKAFGTEEFGQMLEDAMVREDKFTTKNSFAPSGLGYSGKCARKWWYAFKGAEFKYENDPLATANMNAGSASGERIANLLDKAGLLVEAEVPVRHEDPPMFGFIDAFVKWKGEVIVAEVKTTKTETWESRATNSAVPGYQMIQLLIYMYITNKERGFFLTENKNTNEIFILPVRMTDEKRQLVETTLEWLRKVKDNIDNGELPTRPFTRSSLECKGCPVRDTCWPSDYKRGSVNGYDPNPGSVKIEPLNLPK